MLEEFLYERAELCVCVQMCVCTYVCTGVCVQMCVQMCVCRGVCLLFVHDSCLSLGSCMHGLKPVNKTGLKLILILQQELDLELAASMW